MEAGKVEIVEKKKEFNSTEAKETNGVATEEVKETTKTEEVTETTKTEEVKETTEIKEKETNGITAEVKETNGASEVVENNGKAKSEETNGTKTEESTTIAPLFIVLTRKSGYFRASSRFLKVLILVGRCL